MFSTGRALSSPARAEATLRAERGQIIACVRRCDSSSGTRPVLIARPRGLEDSSRNWSVYMTLDHLRIVNTAIAGTIRQLLDGQVPPGRASTAAVKPSPDADASVIGAFADSCEAVIAAGQSGGSLRTRARFSHPWFGPLDAAAWHFMAGFHARLHRTQILRILAGLDQDVGGAEGVR
jgi:hypothetical protein